MHFLNCIITVLPEDLSFQNLPMNPIPMDTTNFLLYNYPEDNVKSLLYEIDSSRLTNRITFLEGECADQKSRIFNLEEKWNSGAKTFNEYTVENDKTIKSLHSKFKWLYNKLKTLFRA